MKYECDKYKGKKLCDFKKVGEDESVLVEVCRFCGRKVRFNKRNGKIDEKRYLELHRRDFLQSRGKDKELFEKIYGK